MEIYKLSDDVSGAVSLRVDKFTITDLRQGVKNPNRVNVFIGGKFAFSLDVAQVVDFRLKIGSEVSEEQLAELRRASEFGKLYQRALEWVLVRPRSEKEIYDYLYKKVYEKKLDKNYINLIIERLKEKKYVDDRKFAEYYVENRFVKKGISRKRLKMELIKKGVAKEIVDEVIFGRDDEEEIDKIIAKKRDKYDDEKLISYLCRQGFSYQLAQSRVVRGKD
ncbi:RecX family transcriptional regulator [Candidatus Saccharibacteria bacterium]|nr:RecX family transcriptional regulator [Candidatus Saccharibacteria bacterium]